MDFLTLAHERYSARSFKSDPVPQDVVDQILEAGRVAPTACNNQPQKILVIRSEEGLAHLKNSTKYHFNAPLALLIGYDPALCWKRSFDSKESGDIDASIVTTHLMLAAASLGIGSTWVMCFDPEVVRKEFSLDAHFMPVAILPMGYPAESCVPAPQHANKKELSETTQFL